MTVLSHFYSREGGKEEWMGRTYIAHGGYLVIECAFSSIHKKQVASFQIALQWCAAAPFLSFQYLNLSYWGSMEKELPNMQ